jgi:hypothetical protein
MSLPTSTLLLLLIPPAILLAVTFIWAARNWNRER